MQTVKDVKKVDNYLTATTGKLNGKDIYINVAKVMNGKIKYFPKYYNLHFPIELHDKQTQILEELKNEC